MKQMIDDNRAFIIDYKLLFGLTDMDDFYDTTKGRTMRWSSSPFCVFVVEKSSKDLKPVAIQTNLTPGKKIILNIRM